MSVEPPRHCGRNRQQLRDVARTSVGNRSPPRSRHRHRAARLRRPLQAALAPLRQVRALRAERRVRRVPRVGPRRVRQRPEDLALQVILRGAEADASCSVLLRARRSGRQRGRRSTLADSAYGMHVALEITSQPACLAQEGLDRPASVVSAKYGHDSLTVDAEADKRSNAPVPRRLTRDECC